jgi:hypothetical protein
MVYLSLSRVDNKVKATGYVDSQLSVWNEEGGESMTVQCEHCSCCDSSKCCTNANGAKFRQIVLVFVECDDILRGERLLEFSWCGVGNEKVDELREG